MVRVAIARRLKIENCIMMMMMTEFEFDEVRKVRQFSLAASKGSFKAGI
jgi:hypothetical protein